MFSATHSRQQHGVVVTGWQGRETGCRSSLSFLIYAHVINQVLLRKNRVIYSLLPSPCSTNRQIENQKLILIERPCIRAGLLIHVGEIFPVIQEKIQVFTIPFERISVKRFRGIRYFDFAALPVLL